MTCPPELRIALEPDEITIDNFAGGGGASTGLDIVLAQIGRHVDIAVNHDAEAIALHKANHQHAEHYVEDVFHIDIVKACRGRRVGFAWYSPDCTFHSKARGGKPFRDRNRARRIRGLAWVIIKQAKELLAAGLGPRIIAMENVQEFADWGPLDENGKIVAVKKGFTFRRWCRQLQNLGYALDMWELKGCDYGAPTTRERLFIVARRDGLPIMKPEATHGPGRKHPWRTAAECIDWSLPCPSIFDRKRPLAENTLRRIAEGIRRFVLNNPQPFIVPVNHTDPAGTRAHRADEPLRTITASRRGDFAVVQPFIAGVGGRMGQSPVRGVDRPMQTVTAKGDAAVITPYIARIGQTGGNGAYVYDTDDPLSTVTTKAEHLLVTPVLVGAGGPARSGEPQSADKPLGTVMPKNDRALALPLSVRAAHGEDGRRGKGQHRTDEPLPTQTCSKDFALVSAIVVGTGGPSYCGKPSPVDRPLGALTAENHRAVVAPVLVPRYGERPGQAPRARSVERPLPTIVATDNGGGLVAAYLAKQNGVGEKNVIGQDAEKPLHTITTKDQKAVVTATLIHNTEVAPLV